MNDKISQRLRAAHPAVFIVVLLLFSFLVVIPLDVVVYFLDLPGPDARPFSGKLWQDIFPALLFAPLIETALFQALPIRLLTAWRVNAWLAVFLSALLFGLSHWYGAGYIVATVLSGLVFAYGYAVKNRRYDRPFLLVSLTHALRNAISLIVLY